MPQMARPHSAEKRVLMLREATRAEWKEETKQERTTTLFHFHLLLLPLLAPASPPYAPPPPPPPLLTRTGPLVLGEAIRLSVSGGAAKG